MKKINLYVRDLLLGHLQENEGLFAFVPHETNIKLARQKYPLEMRAFKLNSSKVVCDKVMPYPFSSFLESTGRIDLIEKVGIEKNQSNFEKLYRLASLDLEYPIFRIKSDI